LAAVDWPRPELRPGLSDAQIAAGITAYAQQLRDAGHFSGVVLAAKADKIVAERAYGQASAATGAANTLDTRFDVGSIGKLFTRVALAQLAAAGKLSLDDTLKSHLPALPVPSSDRITLRQLAEHRSGMGDIFGPRFDAAPPARLRELADFIPLFAGEPLAFEPGSDEAYSNAGYIALGLVIEQVTGQTYRDYVARHILAPAGMTATGYWAIDERGPAIATGYTRRGPDGDRAELAPATAMHSGRPSSAGGARSTARDLLRFWQALRDHRLTSSAWSAWVLDRPEQPGRPMKLGVVGGAPGVNAMLEVSGDWVVIALANLDPPSAIAVARGAVEIIEARRAPDAPPGPRPQHVPPPPTPARR
jgi:CubicO group peptidase (beta-lactamase class C family)